LKNYQVKTMIDTTENNLKDSNMKQNDGQEAMSSSSPEEELSEADPMTTSARFREASYVVLFIAAVFTVNAMETGSYRTPWPVAIITALAGLGLLGYSWYLRKEE